MVENLGHVVIWGILSLNQAIIYVRTIYTVFQRTLWVFRGTEHSIEVIKVCQ